uniref:Uncharacterized protein n=1 Tax=Ditylenchus dipsaci TaxID=166011 RepID=A0A915EL09_9BILA
MIVQVFTISMLNFVATSISVSMMYFVPNVFLYICNTFVGFIYTAYHQSSILHSTPQSAEMQRGFLKVVLLNRRKFIQIH